MLQLKLLFVSQLEALVSYAHGFIDLKIPIEIHFP